MPAPKGNNYAKGNKGGGRKPVFKQEYIELAFKYSLLSATDEQISEFLDCGITTLNKWKKEYKEFGEALLKGKAKADAEIAHSLYHRAKGYECTEVDIRVLDGKIIKTEYKKYYPPDTAAAMIWLKNRQRSKWRDKQPDDDNTPVILAVNVTSEEAKEIADSIKGDI